MRAVNLHLNRAGFGESLSEMRRWLDRNDCVPATFETRTERPRATVLLSMSSSGKTTTPKHSSGILRPIRTRK